MASTRGPIERPLSPHLQIYRLTLTMAMSIAHRVSGAALYFGTLLLVWWLVAAATEQCGCGRPAPDERWRPSRRARAGPASPRWPADAAWMIRAWERSSADNPPATASGCVS